VNLITFEDVQAFKADANETQVALLIPSYSLKVAKAVGRPAGLGYWAGTEKVPTAGGTYLRLSRYPLFDVDTVLYGVDDTELEEWERYDAGDRWGILRRTSGGWPAKVGTVPLTQDLVAGTDFVTVDYEAGYALPGQTVPDGVPELPGDIKMACIELVLNKLGRGITELSGKHVSEERVGAMSIRYGAITAQTSAASAEAKILAELAATYKRPWCP
jgi:hypothetical protein